VRGKPPRDLVAAMRLAAEMPSEAALLALAARLCDNSVTT